ncbi:MAG: L-histidine N(alpha)-methyltransferase [bacterium]|nr:L-histidine N(alpha)-methyltransferase [bacterium]
MADDVRRGLTASPKRLPSKYFYDERGSELFERITELPEYYLTRIERGLLERHAPAILRHGGARELVELGAGSATKTRLLLDAGRDEGSLRRYVPLEVSREIAEVSAREIAGHYPDLSVHVVVGDFEGHMDEVPGGDRRLVAFLGSTIGNFPREQAVEFLSEAKLLLRDGGHLLLGADLVKDRSSLEAAYNDSRGITAEFNRNILQVVNHHLEADFDPEKFEHIARYNPELQRIESSLRSTEEQTVRLGDIDLEVRFERDELLHTEVSCKYTRDSLSRLLCDAGYELERWFADDSNSFALALAAPVSEVTKPATGRTLRRDVPQRDPRPRYGSGIRP